VKGRKQFFFEKKNQKTFVLRLHQGVVILHQKVKVFWFFSSEKNGFLLTPCALGLAAGH
jgi:hypothetical protein